MLVEKILEVIPEVKPKYKILVVTCDHVPNSYFTEILNALEGKQKAKKSTLGFNIVGENFVLRFVSRKKLDTLRGSEWYYVFTDLNDFFLNELSNFSIRTTNFYNVT